MAAFVGIFRRSSLLSSQIGLQTVIRGAKNWQSEVDKQLYRRRLVEGPEPLRPRSSLPNWDYGKELRAFNRRFSENVEEPTLSLAFQNRSVDVTASNDVQVGSEVESRGDSTPANAKLTDSGRILCESCLRSLTQKAFPNLPDMGVESVLNYLLSDKVLLHIASNLGLRDLIVCEEIPPSNSTMINTLLAVVGAIHQEGKEGQAGLFVRDFLFTELLDKDVNNLMDIVSPMGLLTRALSERGRGEPESRILREAGACTVEAVYEVGIYSDRNLIGQSPGETPLIAEEMAARDALANLFGTRLYNQDAIYKVCAEVSSPSQPS